MALAERVPRSAPKGKAKPRLAPPVPARSDVPGFKATAEAMGITLMPYQEVAARYLTAKGRNGPLYREVCIVVARQNGKTTLAKPLIVRALREGKKVMHIAQNRELPRHMFKLIASELDESLFAKRRGKGGKMHTIWPRAGSGQEEIELANGGWYRIAAATSGGARGWSTDLVVIDELREMTDAGVMAAIEPTLMMSTEPQIVYLSNAGDESSVVLNSVRDRAGKDETLAYLEWSAAPERTPGDRAGWAEANPALGHFPQVLRTLEASYRKHSLAGTLAYFETENLCRSVATMRDHLVDPAAWASCEVDSVGAPTRSRNVFMSVAMDPDGARASAALAWAQDDGGIALQILHEATGSPVIDTDLLGPALRDLALKHRVSEVAYDPMTDAELAKFFKRTRKVSGPEFANASARFVWAVKTSALRWSDAAAVSDDLVWTVRKNHAESGSFMAVRAQEDHPITASLAAIRAVWLASGPKPAPPRIY